MSDNNTEEQISKPTFIVNLQYVKDLSFENPKSPSSLFNEKEYQTLVNINVNATPLAETVVEVVLHIRIDGQATEEMQDDGEKKFSTIFVLDLSYAGLFTINGYSDQEKEVLSLVQCPSLLFPYARQIVSDTIRNGGYRPVMLMPFDFMRMYQEHQNSIQKS